MLPNARETIDRIFGKTTAPEAFHWGAGVVGYTTRAILGLFTVCAVIGYALSGTPLIALIAIVVVVLAAGFYLYGTWRFADKHPELAAMGGSNYRRWKELQMAAQGYPALPVGAPVQDPGPEIVVQPPSNKPEDSDGA